MAGRVLQVEIVSHEGRLWHGVGSPVQIPIVGGQLGVLPGRQPLLAMLKAGTVTVQTSQGMKISEVEDRFTSVDSDFATVAAGRAIVS